MGGSLVPAPVFVFGLRANHVFVYSPLAGCPANDHVGGSCVLPVHAREGPLAVVGIILVAAGGICIKLCGRRNRVIGSVVVRNHLTFEWNDLRAPASAVQRGALRQRAKANRGVGSDMI